ncbi:hypothetical protein BIY23_01610 [Wolbachia pipientis]|uniref:Uncharacterized protein n=1 Tax=Wolbachia pipientis TaxID=955 RepID=A0A1E7QL70_WOLPI|nr:hypothetical protein [Wolbachia pipientis]OEY87157.1 hypothetical protein BIY23_01610 [Wolbachia pipientis]
MSKFQSYKISSKLTNSESRTKKSRDKFWKQFEKQINKDKRNSKIIRHINHDIKNHHNIEERLNTLLKLTEQAESFLKEHKNEWQIKSDSSIVFHEISTTVLTKRSIRKRKLHNKTLSSNQDDFEEALNYIKSLEVKVGITLKALKQYEHSAPDTDKIWEIIKALIKKIKAYFQEYFPRFTKKTDTMKNLSVINPSTIVTWPECNVQLISITNIAC